jgi:hypothetical protein
MREEPEIKNSVQVRVGRVGCHFHNTGEMGQWRPPRSVGESMIRHQSSTHKVLYEYLSNTFHPAK